MKKKIVSILLSSVLMVGLLPICANAEWRKDNTGWWYTEGNSYVKNNWKLINGNWYYFGDNGYMKVGWLQDTNRKWYYLSQDGSMLSNTVTPDGYTLNSDGSWNKSVLKVENKTMATSSSVNITSDENTENDLNKETKIDNNENNMQTKITKKRSSSSSSSSTQSITKDEGFNYVYVYYSDGGVIQVIRSNEEPPEANNTLPFAKIDPKEYGFNNYFDFMEDKKGHLNEYMIKDNKFIKKENAKENNSDNANSTTTDDSVKFV